jgi:hypothetical protein
MTVMLTENQEQYIEHEVKIRLLEGNQSRFETTFKSINERFQHLENKMDSHFKWTMGTIIAMILSIVALFGGLILTKFMGG